jgi:hypothetical protein
LVLQQTSTKSIKRLREALLSGTLGRDLVLLLNWQKREMVRVPAFEDEPDKYTFAMRQAMYDKYNMIFHQVRPRGFWEGTLERRKEEVVGFRYLGIVKGSVGSARCVGPRMTQTRI